MKKLISLSFLSLSLMACGEQLQSNYVGNAQIHGTNTCFDVEGIYRDVQIVVRARISGNQADFNIMSANAIDSFSEGFPISSTAAKQAFDAWFIRPIRTLAVNIINETMIQEKDELVQVRLSPSFSAGLTDAQIEEYSRETLTVQGDLSVSRDRIEKFSVKRKTRKNSDNGLVECEISFDAPVLLRQ